MKSFQAIIIAAIFAAATAANEPVASPAAANVERELAEYEKRHLQQQGTPASSPPQPTIPRPGVSSLLLYLICDLSDAAASRHSVMVAADGPSPLLLCCRLFDRYTHHLSISLFL
jgi:hypothetical protein